MINKILTAVFATSIVGFSAMAQGPINSYDSIVYNFSYSLNGGLDFSASAIENTILSKFYRGGFIDEQMKDDSFSKHRPINRAGLDIGGEFVFVDYKNKLFKNKDWGIQAQIGYYNFGGVLYSDDLFGLAFYGNQRYVGDTIKMSGTDLSFTSFQKFGFGLIDPKTKSSVSINYYNISDRISGDFRDLEIQQSADGMEVVVVMDGEVQMKQNNNFNQGFGVGVDLDFRLNVAWYKDRNAKIQFLAKNIGFGYMTQKQKQYSFDTTLTYTGFEFSDLIGDNAILSDSINLLDTLGIASSEVNPVFMLPGYLQVGKMIDRNSAYKLQSFFGIRLYPTLIYSPYIFAGVNYKTLDWLNVGASLSYGGFAGFKTGIYANLNLTKFQAGIGTENLIGMVSKKGNGQSIYLKLRCTI